MFEDNKANISYVYQRWIDIKAHLQNYSKRPSLWAANIEVYLMLRTVTDRLYNLMPSIAVFTLSSIFCMRWFTFLVLRLWIA